MSAYILSLNSIDKTQTGIAGGKAANLGELARIDGVQVPGGFCITTEAFKAMMADNPAIGRLLNQLSSFKVEDKGKIRELSAEIRKAIEETTIPDTISGQISDALLEWGEQNAYAIRSSATAEDLPGASFAGQQDTYLNIIGSRAILLHIQKCWASLFTERAVMYRMQNHFDHSNVYTAVIVQRMVFPQAAGILFTADPVTANRKILTIDAGFGLGEALVSGLVNADNYKVNDGNITDKKIAVKKVAIYAIPGGGTKEQAIEAWRQNGQVLTDQQILELERTGRKIEKHFTYPQDIEWCWNNDGFYILQGRPITTLFPVPKVPDEDNHVYVSVGHQQMMTDAMKPLGISFWQLMAGRPMIEAGGRMFVDITQELISPVKREVIVNVLGKSDPIMKDALMTVLARPGFLQLLPDEQKEQTTVSNNKAATFPDFQTLKDYDPSIAADLILGSQASIEKLKQDIQSWSGAELFDFIVQDVQQMKQRVSGSPGFGVIMTAMNASAWLNEKMQEWLGEKNVADTLSQSAPGNITSEMGLALLDVADVIRPHKKVIEYLQQVKDENFLDELPLLDGGAETKQAITAYLDKYGMRCAGEIDITRTRWSEKPAILLPLLLSNIKNFEPLAGKRKFEKGLQEAMKKEQDVLKRLSLLPGGAQKVKETTRMMGLLRNLIGYREYPKYEIISRYFVYKQALLKEAGQLIQAGIIKQVEDMYYLRFEEIRAVVLAKKIDYNLIDQRKKEYQFYKKLSPPRVMTSDGEIITSKYKRENIPGTAIAGLPVSSGVTEGRARVIVKMEDADIEEGDILVTVFTDPSWTPLFVAIKGLVTEVGGLMTHGAVIAREYGLPAIVGVENATRLIKDGARIRVNGTDGYLEILREEEGG